MPDTGISTTEPASASEAVAASPSDRAEKWHEHLASHGSELHDEMLEAREALHMGTPSDAIEFANRDVPREADEAAARWQTGAHA